jgi:hypothetical protein
VNGHRQLAVHVQLELLRSSVADPHGARALVAGQLVDLELGQTALAADAVHDLDLGRMTGGRPADVVCVGQRLVRVAAAEERGEGQGRVTQPQYR